MLRYAGFVLVAALLADPSGWISRLLEHAMYPGLLGILVIASLGVPIPEDIPLLLAGVILRNQQDPDEVHVASWQGVLIVALIGIMIGDLVLYSLGRRWGRDLFKHKWVSRLVTPRRYERFSNYFHKYGMWACFFGRFFMGVRAAMCLTAGATHFPYWRFFLADFAGALLSVPFFVILGYVGRDQLPTIIASMKETQGMILGILAGVLLIAVVVWKIRHMIRASREDTADANASSSAAQADAKSDAGHRSAVSPGANDATRGVLPRPTPVPAGSTKE